MDFSQCLISQAGVFICIILILSFYEGVKYTLVWSLLHSSYATRNKIILSFDLKCRKMVGQN